MLRPHRCDREIDPGPVQIQARRVHFDVADIPLHWIPGHPVASHVVSMLNVVLPAGERWFVQTFNEALPFIEDPKLADDVRGFIGQEATHADVHERILHEYMEVHGVDAAPLLAQIEHIFSGALAPSDTPDPRRRMNHLRERLWLIAAIEHYTAVMGDFALNCAWDDHHADPTLVDLFRWHGSEEVEHRSVAHDVATYFDDSYLSRIRAMSVAATMLFVFFQRGAWYLVRTDPNVDANWWTFNRMRMRDSKLGLLPRYRQLFGTSTLAYFRPRYSPADVGSTAQAVAYLAASPAARAAHL
ncbi:metal-dependent hydrolase [Mycolicibacterium duvalii]|uniref:Metal-dependent hydrolase n=1 Tax=Mycolicibacterium duvalii TaxID=39688 RepID=A0A7I7JXA3_9MYCO|nr:metal-dependent hydrolase [Mycolicibacterium duvalii]MCV7370336.1 metal-dependent hydrolase [Mycolicibacterium duvalii]PEG37301.1 metal-dependent hydrolase [Mycolicibacterium duvalii]BBX16486.1 metal-dependent hydrolase [Mycolicibacterium duvalii]